MSPAAKPNRESIAEELSDTVAARDDITALFLRGWERIADVQKQWMDFAVQQNVEIIDGVKKAVEKMPGAPRLPMLDLADGAVKRYADTHKAAIDFAVEQGRIWTDTFKAQTSRMNKSTENTSNVAKQTMERSFAVQKKALEHSAAHAKAVVDATKRQFGFTGTQADAMTDTFRRGVDTIVEAQKELMDIVTH